MNKRLMKFAMYAGLALVLALPALALTQADGPHESRWDSRPPGEFSAGGQTGPQATERRSRGRTGAAEAQARAGVGSLSRRERGRNTRRGGRGQGPNQAGRSTLAARALAQGERIALAAEQSEQILAAQRVAQEASINRRAATQIAQLQLRDLMAASAPDTAAIEVTLREIAEHDIAGRLGALRLDEAVTEVLSEEQLSAIQDQPRSRRSLPGRPTRRNVARTAR